MRQEEDAAGLVGQVLSERYRLDGLLATGGMGAVYAGTHLKLDRQVAIKVLHPIVASEPNALDRFFQEARAAAAVDSVGVVDVTDLEVDEHLGPYLVMERLEGEPLTDRLRRGKLPPEEAVELIGQLLDVLTAVHAHQIIHRDLKPPNVFLHTDDAGERVVKVLDFGIAKVQQQHLTLTGEVVGTPRYMAPEQAQGEDLDPRTDLYGAGLLLYCCLSGRPPFEGMAGGQMLPMLEQGPKPLRELEPNLPEALLRVVERATAVDPDQRYDSAEAMAEALRGALGPARPSAPVSEPDATPADWTEGQDTEPEPTKPASTKPASTKHAAPEHTAPKRSKRSPITLLVVAFLLLALALAVGLFVFRNISLTSGEGAAAPRLAE